MDELGIGIIGCGGISRTHARAYQLCPGVRIRAVADVDAGAAQRLAAELGVEACYTDYRELLAQEGIDAVSICTPHAFHCEQFLAAVDAGKHVCVEKPMGMNPRETAAMLEAARRADLITCLGLPLRYYPCNRRIKALVEAGQVGRVALVKQSMGADVCCGPDGKFVRHQHWLSDVRLSGGGMLIGQTVHYLDLLTWLVPSPVVAVTASVWAAAEGTPEGFDTNVVVLLEHADGTRALVENSWWANYHPAALEVYGSAGTIIAADPGPYPSQLTVQWFPRRSPLPELAAGRGHGIVLGDPIPLGNPAEGHRNIIAEFIGSIRAGRPQGDLPTGEHGHRLQLLIEAGYQSSREGRRVSLGEAAV